MNRRDALKGLAAAGTIALLPQLAIATRAHQLPIHFIGLGGAGCNGLEVIYEKDIAGKFTCITHPQRPNLPVEIRFVEFIPPGKHSFNDKDELIHIRTDMTVQPQLADEMKQLLSQNYHYVLLAGLGGYTGTKLLQAFTQILQANSQPFTVVASLPFTWETGRRKELEKLLPAFHALPRFYSFDLNELAAKGDNKKMNMKVFMQLANEQFYTIYQQNYLS